MQSSFFIRRRWQLPSLVIVLIALAGLSSAAGASTTRAAASVKLAPVGMFTAGPARLANPSSEPTINVPSRTAPFRPTMGEAAYAAAKALGAQSTSLARPSSRTSGPQQPTFSSGMWDGPDSTNCGGCYPPDINGASGLSGQLAVIVNQRYQVYPKPTVSGVLPAPTTNVSLNTFFGYGAAAIFDPRVTFDNTWNRWIVSAEAFPESPTVQYQFFAISKNNNANGPYFFYKINMNFGADPTFFWDYPAIGMSQDAITLTGNVFCGSPQTYCTGYLFGLPKAKMYNGLPFSMGGYSCACGGTITPAMALTNNPNAYYLINVTGGASVGRVTVVNPQNPGYQSAFLAYIPLSYTNTVPPNAPQPGTALLIDTSDTRYVNDPTVVGDKIFAAHANGCGAAVFSFASFEELDLEGAGADTEVTHQCVYYSGSSFDYNPSIMASTAGGGNAVMTWSASDSGLNPSVIYSGRKNSAPDTFPFGNLLFTSPSNLTGNPCCGSGTTQRWGDTSSVSVDLSLVNTWWIFNEDVLTPSIWGTKIAKIRY